MPISSYHDHIEELRPGPPSFGLEEWNLTRRFRVIGRSEIPPIDGTMATACPGIPPFYSSYFDFSANVTIPNAILVGYEADPQENAREWIITCRYSTRLPATQNAGGLQTPSTASQSPQSGSSNPADLTQLLPRLSKSVETIKLPYKFDPQDDAFFTNSDGGILPVNNQTFRLRRFCNSTGENFAAGASIDYNLTVYRVSFYKTYDVNVYEHGGCVNENVWDEYDAKSIYCKPPTSSRELVANNLFWLWNYELVWDPIYLHRFTLLNAGFRELKNALRVDQNGVRELQDIILPTSATKTSVEVPLDINGKAIYDPGIDGGNLVFCNFNKYPTADFSTMPFTLSALGFV